MIDKTCNAVSDIRRLGRSVQLIAPADETYLVFPLPKNAFVMDVVVNMTTAFTDAGATMKVGFTGNGETDDDDAFLLSADIDPSLTGTTLSSVNGNGVSSRGKWFSTSGGGVTVTVDDNGGTAGTFQIFIDYAILN
jgi:hypothetical protein